MSANDPPPSLTTLFLRMGGWWVIVLGTIVLMVTLLSESRASLARQFALESRTAEARVINRYIRQQDGGTDQVSFIVAIDFTTADGERIVLERGVPEESFQRMMPGSRVDVQYLPDTPRRVEVTEGAYRSGAVALQRVALAFGIFWLFLLWRIGTWAVSAVRARESGPREEVEVLRVQRTPYRVRRQRYFRLVWRDGQGEEGESLLNWRRVVAPHRPGTTTHVYRDGRATWWVGDVGERQDV
ncbi:MAG: DUF3592 domain-containing protein [Pseudomonadota bacterium]